MEYEKGTRVFEGPVKCATWIRWSGKRNDGNPQNLPQKQTLAVQGRWKSSTCAALIEIFSFDSLTLSLSSSPLVSKSFFFFLPILISRGEFFPLICIHICRRSLRSMGIL